VKVFAVSPGATATEFFDVSGAKPAGNLATPADVVRVIIQQLDSAKPAPSTIVGWQNRIMARVSRIVPVKAAIAVAGSLFLPKK
jgi:short-subunit dehydrogenase